MKSPARIAVVIPTYNNAATIAAVIAGVERSIHDIIVVNDGSIDGTGAVVASLAAATPGVRLVEFPRNRGKGSALKAGFEKALSCGFTNVITIDADGQHIAEDVPSFIEKINSSPQTLFVGDRVMRANGGGQPFRSSFGRAFGAFWYRFFTEKNIRDTQCGFRAYPLEPVLRLGCKGRRYEFEQEVLIYAAWNGMDVQSVPIHLYYSPKTKAVSHFRPCIDFLRIAAVNSRAGLVKILLPWKTVNAPGKTWRQKLLIVLERELNAISPHKGARSLAMGVCVGIMPIYGFQLLLLMAMTPFLRLNWPLAFLGACVSTPPVIPFLIAAGIAIGKVIVPFLPLTNHLTASVNALVKGGIEWLVGSIALAMAAGLVTYGVFYPVLASLNRQKIKRTGGQKVF
jgi:glycosyltransferase involved in cell wall biosynthesis